MSSRPPGLGVTDATGIRRGWGDELVKVHCFRVLQGACTAGCMRVGRMNCSRIRRFSAHWKPKLSIWLPLPDYLNLTLTSTVQFKATKSSESSRWGMN